MARDSGINMYSSLLLLWKFFLFDLPNDTGTGGEPVVLGEHHEGGGDQVEGAVQSLHSATSGQL